MNEEYNREKPMHSCKNWNFFLNTVPTDCFVSQEH